MIDNVNIVYRIRRKLENIIVNNFAIKGVSCPIEESSKFVPIPLNYNIEISSAPKLAVICPIFHEELSEELKNTIANIPFPTDVYISTDTTAKMTHIIESFGKYNNGKVDVRLSKNRGRDIAPKITVFTDVYGSYDLILYLHSKKSLTFTIGDWWRKFLTNNLVGSKDIVKSIIEIFVANPNVGLVMSTHFEPIGHLIKWDGNYRKAKSLASKMGINITRKSLIDMPSGSMFWFRPVALKPLLDLKLNQDDFPVEKGQLRNTLHHAIERLILYIVESSGFVWVKVGNSDAYKDDSECKTISSRLELIDFIKDGDFNLLGNNK